MRHKTTGNVHGIALMISDETFQICCSFDAAASVVLKGEFLTQHVQSFSLMLTNHKISPQPIAMLRWRADDFEVIVVRVDKDGQTWAPLLRELQEAACQPAPFLYPNFPTDVAELLPWLTSEEFLHFSVA